MPDQSQTARHLGIVDPENLAMGTGIIFIGKCFFRGSISACRAVYSANLRYFDYVVIRHFLAALEDQDQEGFDTVMGAIQRRGEIVPGSGFKEKTYVQIAVRSNQCIESFFRVEQPLKLMEVIATMGGLLSAQSEADYFRP